MKRRQFFLGAAAVTGAAVVGPAIVRTIAVIPKGIDPPVLNAEFLQKFAANLGDLVPRGEMWTITHHPGWILPKA